MDSQHKLIGTVLGKRYRLTRWIGGGGFSDVFQAEDIRFVNERVAVKVLKPEFARRLAIEARISRRFKHPNAVDIMDMGVEDEIPYMVMEYLEGRTLDQLKPISSTLLKKFVREIADVLQHAHNQGLVHRDLKPENIMLVDPGTSRERFKILDFGIAAQLNAELTLRNATMDGGGTLDYMPPEQLCGDGSKQPTPQTDIYAFGVILYELLTGRKPFYASGPSLKSLLNAIETEPPPRFREAATDREIDSVLESLVLQCLSKSPEFRPSSIAEVAERFQAVEDEPVVMIGPATIRPDVPAEPTVLLAGTNEDTAPLEIQPTLPPSAPPAPPPPQYSPPPPPAYSPPAPPSPAAPEHTMAPAVRQPEPSPDWGATQPPRGPSAGGPAETRWPQGVQSPGTAEEPPPAPSWMQAGAAGQTAAKSPPQSYVAVERQPGFAWLRNSILVVLALLLILAGTFLIVRRQTALARNQNYLATQQFDTAAADLQGASFWTHPWIDREKLLQETHDRWVQYAGICVDKNDLPQAIKQCRLIDDQFRDDPAVEKLLNGISDQLKQRARDQAEQGDYEQAVAVLDDRTVAVPLARIGPKYLDPALERQDILKAGLARLTSLSDKQQYAKVLDSGASLQRAFPEELQIRTALQRARILAAVQAADAEIAAGHLAEGAAGYDSALALNPEPDLKREILWKRIRAFHQRAEAELKKLPEDMPPEAETTHVLSLVSQVLADLKRITQATPTDAEVPRWKGKAYFLRAGIQGRRAEYRLAICDLKLALQADRSAVEAAAALQRIGQESTTHSLEMYQSALQEELQTSSQNGTDAGDMIGTVQSAAERDMRWQSVLDQLNLAILARETSLAILKKELDPQACSLYSCRADVRARLTRPDYTGALQDMEKFEQLTRDIAARDPEVLDVLIHVLAKRAWILATCGVPEIRNPAEALVAAQQAHDLWEKANTDGVVIKDPAVGTEKLQSYVQRSLAVAAAANRQFDRALEISTGILSDFGRDSLEGRLHSQLINQYFNEERPYLEPTREPGTTTQLECPAE